MEAPELRIARPSDVDAIAGIARDYVERGLKWTWKPGRVARTLADTDVLCVVAGEVLQGFCITKFGVARAHLLLIGVLPEARRSGVGTQLVQWQIECARTAGMTEVALELRAGNAGARRFYEKLGFENAGRARCYYQDREDALRMRLPLIGG